MKIDGYEDVEPDNEDALMSSVAQQPVSVAINAGTRDFQLYAGVGLLTPLVMFDTKVNSLRDAFLCQVSFPFMKLLITGDYD